MSSVIEEIKSRLNIVDIAQGYLKLEGAGGNYKARCPFHNEQTPSFFISPSRQTYHCFGCNRGGDLISFVEEIEGLDFSGALKILAERAGVTLDRGHGGSSKESKDEREALYYALNLATKFYEAVLPKFPVALEYLKNRGLNPETIKHFRVGFAPDEWRSLSDFLTKKGVTEDTMEKAGLVVRSQKGIYDRFRGRLMFPITDSSGRVIAFSGRILGTGEGKTLGASASAKYVNSPETEVFHKSRALFGFYQAKDAMRRENSCVLVEGQLDLVLSHQSGVTNTCASSGTALTSEHLALIKRFTKNIVLAFDADDAGLAAAHRAIGLALSQDMTVRIAGLPRGMDPADMALKSPREWQDAVKSAKNVIDFYLELLPTLYPDKTVLRAKVSEIIVPFVAEQKSAIDQGYYVGQIAKLLGIKEEPVWDEVKKRSIVANVVRGTEKLMNPVRGREGSQRAPTSNGMNEVVPLSRLTRIARTINGALLWQESAQEPILSDVKKYRIQFEKLSSEALSISSPPDPVRGREGSQRASTSNGTDGRDKLIFEAEARFHGNENVQREIEELLKNMEEEIMREKFSEKMKQLKEAETRGSIEQAQKLLVECQEISKQLHLLVNSPK